MKGGSVGRRQEGTDGQRDVWMEGERRNGGRDEWTEERIEEGTRRDERTNGQTDREGRMDG